MQVSARRRAVTDVIGLGVVLLALVDLLRPALLVLPTITAGGDTPCHYPTAVWFHERLLPEGRLHGWYPGSYLGHPLLLYYFPFPFLVMSALSPLVGMPVAFKLGTALPVLLLPLLVYASFRLMRFAFPAPLLGAAAALVFLYVEDTPIWGGSVASTLAGEFSYTYGTGFAILFLGVLVRARAAGWSPWWPAAALALTAYAHGYAVLWAGLTAAGVLLLDPAPAGAAGGDPARRLGWLLSVAALAFGLSAPALVPLLGDWGWTTPYDDAWIDVTSSGGARASGRARAARALGPAARPPAAARLRRAGGRGAGRGRAGPGRDRRALRPAGAAVAGSRRSRRRGVGREAPGAGRRRGAGAGADRPGVGGLALAGAALLDVVELLGARGQGAVAGLAAAHGAPARRT